ncbi:MAG: hypothetical protein ACRYFS_20055 [Janthinobacterium lividum]
MKDKITEDKVIGFDPWTAAVQEELTANSSVYTRELASDMTLDVIAGHESLWLVVRGLNGGGVAFRTAYAPGASLEVEAEAIDENSAQFTVQTTLGLFQVKVEMLNSALLHWTTTLTPAFDLFLPFSPVDIYPLDKNSDPRGTLGTAHAGQAKVGAAVLFLTQTEPSFGSVLYLQNYAALNPLFEKLRTVPNGLIGGKWPQLGFALPASDVPLPANEAIVVSDAFVRLSTEQPKNERQAARLFLDSLAAIYPYLPQPELKWRDWPSRAADTLADLQTGEGCLVTHHDHTYALPYLSAEQPDSMVQLALTLPLLEYQDWTGTSVPLADTLRAAVPTFYDAPLGAMRRFLPDVGHGKDRAESDSWYLYHPLLDLARLAKRGDDEARRLLFASLEHAINAARHFEYRWPVKFNLETLEVMTEIRKPDEPGQSDVGGIYAAVMIEAWDLTGEARYLEEAKSAVRALSGYRFAVGYQFNITAIGAAACLRLWEETGDDFFRDQSLVLLASFFHHTTFYDCHLGAAKFFPSFLGVLCLHDAEYTAVFEAFESFAAFHEVFSRSGEALPESARLLIAEYCRHLLNRAWFYYPGEMPEEALATEIRNGHLDRNLAIPMEDLYPIGDPAGAVGQEVYGAGAAFVFATRTFHRPSGIPFQIACDYPLTVTSAEVNCATMRVHGVSAFSCRLKLISKDGPLPSVSLYVGGKELTGAPTRESEQEYMVPGGSDIEVRW